MGDTNDLSDIRLPRPVRAPLAAVARRIVFAVALVIFVALVVLVGRDGYVDVNEDSISFLDAVYYASVTVTTTGYGDITAVSDRARLATALLITPARIVFLILVVGTTVEVLTEQGRTALAIRRWSRRMKNHYVICGFGSTGQAAVRDLLSRDLDPSQIVVVDLEEDAIEIATAMGLVGIHGDATHNSVLQQANIDQARAIIVAPNRDDTAVLITLTVRELNETARIVASGREQENLHLLRQGGADEVIDSTAAVGRMLGMGTYAPEAVAVIEDLLDAGDGLQLMETEPDLTGPVPSVPAGCVLVSIIRDGQRVNLDSQSNGTIRADDQLIVFRRSV
jgi:voltage-gated potassium channel